MAAEQGFRLQDQPDEEENCHAVNRIMDEFASHRYWCYRSRQLEEPSGESRLKQMEFLGATGQTPPFLVHGWGEQAILLP